MSLQLQEILRGIRDKYEGPVFVERVYHLAKTYPEFAARASKDALRYLDHRGFSSPLVEELLELLKFKESANDGHLSEKSEGEGGFDEEESRYRSTQWTHSLRMMKERKLKELDADNLFHETDVTKNIRVAIIYMYSRQFGDAQNAIGSSTVTVSTCELAEYAAQSGLLQGATTAVGNYSTVFAQDKRIDSFLSTSISNEIYLKRLTDSEITSYWRVKFLILYANFLKQNYEEVIKQAYDLVEENSIHTTSQRNISALEILNQNDFNKFIDKDEIRTAVAYSLLLTRPASELNDLFTEEQFVHIMGSKLGEFRPLFTALNSANFKDLFSLLKRSNVQVQSNLFLSKVWPNIQLLLRRKSYELYLSLIVKVRTGHLSQKLGIQKLTLIRELKEYIREKKCDFRLTDDDEVLEKFKGDKKVELYDKLEKLAEEADDIEEVLKEKNDEVKRQISHRDPQHKYAPPRSPDLVSRAPRGKRDSQAQTEADQDTTIADAETGDELEDEPITAEEHTVSLEADPTAIDID